MDQNIIASMLRFARLHRDNACVGIISEDQDFAQSLLYCRSLGCHTVAVCKWATSCIGYSSKQRPRERFLSFQPAITECLHTCQQHFIHIWLLRH